MEKTHPSPFEAALELIAQTTTLDDLSSLMTELRDLYGLANIVYHAVYLPTVQTPNPVLLLTYDPEWVKRYTDRNYYEVDPVVINGRSGFLPIDWSEVDHESFEAKRFFKEADKFSVGRRGVTIPIRGPGGERALLSITSNVTIHEWNRSRLIYMRDFQLLGHLVHDRAMRISNLRFTQTKLALSGREKECIQLAARGLTPKQTAGHLNLSSQAVRLYLQSARNKLECASVNQAIAKAISLEIIEA